jgi:hypothetical protein
VCDEDFFRKSRIKKNALYDEVLSDDERNQWPEMEDWK